MIAKTRQILPISLNVFFLALIFSLHSKATAGVFTNVGSLSVPRYLHTATLLPNGKVLVAGGSDGTNSLSGAELYDPATGQWSATAAMSSARATHIAVLLANGKVLVAGGFDTNSQAIAAAELYDPVTGTWAATGPMNFARGSATAVRLPGGQVLIATGRGTNELSSAEVYDPASGTWSNTASVAFARAAAAMTVLQNGQALLLGGVQNKTNYISDPEFYDPASGNWTLAYSNHNAILDRAYHTMTVLPDGRVIVAGGLNDKFVLQYVAIFNPATMEWTNGNGMNTPGFGQAATLLPNGKILCTGYINNSELFDPVSGKWANGPSMHFNREYHTSTLLANGGVLLVGGFHTGATASAELYASSPASGPPPISGTRIKGSFQLSFTNTPGASFGVWGTTNVANSQTNWSALGDATEISPGHFRFIDTQNATSGQRYYSVRSQ